MASNNSKMVIFMALFIAFSLSSIRGANGARQLPRSPMVAATASAPLFPVVPPLPSVRTTPNMNTTVPLWQEAEIMWPTDHPLGRLLLIWQVSSF
ncbi:hypothetical protein U1Q18_035294 [Sarracenia purpurea var. burkii]